MRKLIVSFAVLCLTCSLWAQEKSCAMRGITTTGTAEVNVAPDEVVLQVGVQSQSPRAKTAKATVDATSRKILAAIKELGIDAKDVQTAYLSLQPQFDYRKGMRISYFSAEQSLTVKVRDVSKVDDVLDALIRAGGNRVDGIEYQSSEMRKYRDQAREAAVKAAREKAEALARALGQEIGKAYKIEEPQMDAGYGFMANAAMDRAIGTRHKLAPATAAGELKVTATVTVTFDLM